MPAYTYSISSDTENAKVDPSNLASEINGSAIVGTMTLMDTDDDVLDIYFSTSLSVDDESLLDGIVAAHDGVPASDASVDADGIPLSRSKETKTGWQYHDRSFEITFSKLNGFVELEPDLTDPLYSTVKFYKANGDELVQGGSESDVDFQTRLDTDCVKTNVDWMPTHDYEIRVGELTHISPPTNDIRLFAIGVPAYPAPTGSKVFINNFNLKYLGAYQVKSVDGKTAKMLKYNNPAPGTNTMRMQFNHTAGENHTVQVTMGLFKS